MCCPRSLSRTKTWAAAFWCVAIALTGLHVTAQDEVDDSWVSQVACPGASYAVVSDTANALFVGGVDEKGGYIAGYALQADGMPAETPVRLALSPVGPGIAARPIAMASHPSQPLVYVWLDAQPVEGASPSDEAMAKFDHLLICEWQGGQLKPRLQTSRGESYTGGKTNGSITVDEKFGRLFLPNLMMPGDEDKAVGAIGFAPMGSDGLPELDEKKQPVLELQPIGRAGARAGWPCGLAVVKENVAIFGSGSGMVTWSMDSPRQRFGQVTVRWIYGHAHLAMHPTLDLVYLTPKRTSVVYSMHHAHGYLTMMSRENRVAARAQARPVVVPSRDVLVMGGASGGLVLIPIDTAGQITGRGRALRAGKLDVVAYDYSAKHDRLYVAPGDTL